MRIWVLVDSADLCRKLRATFISCLNSACAPTLHFPASWDELRTQARLGGCDLALVDPCFRKRAEAALPDLLALEHLASVLSRDRIVLFLSRPYPRPHDLRALNRAGFPYLVMEGIDDDPYLLLRVLARADGRRLLRSELAYPRSDRPGERSQDLLLAALTSWPPAPNAAKLAEHLALSRRTLERKMNDAGFLPPGRCISLGRFLEASTLRAWGLKSRSRIASTLGMNGPDSLAHLCKRLTGRPLKEFWCEEPEETPFRYILVEIKRGRQST